MSKGFKVGPRRPEDVTWPGFKTARPGIRVKHNISGAEGTFIRVVAQSAQRSAARIRWDNGYSGIVTAPMYDLTPISETFGGTL